MMGNYYDMMGTGMGTWSFFGFFTWLLIIIFLVMGRLYFWKEINKKK